MERAVERAVEQEADRREYAARPERDCLAAVDSVRALVVLEAGRSAAKCELKLRRLPLQRRSNGKRAR